MNIPYLKREPKSRIPIKFDRIVRIENDNFERGKNILFGVDMVKEPSITEVPIPLFSLKRKRKKKLRISNTSQSLNLSQRRRRSRCS